MTITTPPPQQALDVARPDYWSEGELSMLQAIGLSRNCNRGDLTVFRHVCERTGLDPFARQIHMIERRGLDGRPKQTIQTGIDGFRLIAHRAAARAGVPFSISESLWCGRDGVWKDVWLPTPEEPHPAAAKVTVTKGGGTFPAVGLWHEYAQYKRDGQLTSMWNTRGAGQLAKCTEALALRKAFPADMAGVYTTDELGQETPRDASEHETPQAPPTKDANARLRAHMGIAPEEPPAPVNRGEDGGEGQGPGPTPPDDDEVSDADVIDETTGEITTPQPDTRRVTAGQLTKLWQAFEAAGYDTAQKDPNGTPIVLTRIRQVTGNHDLSESKHITRHEWAEVMQDLDVIITQRALIEDGVQA